MQQHYYYNIHFLPLFTLLVRRDFHKNIKIFKFIPVEKKHILSNEMKKAQHIII